MPDGEDDDGVSRDPIPGDIACRTERYEELAKVRSVRIDRTQTREILERRQPLDDRVEGARRGVGILLGQEPMKPLQAVIKV